MVVLVCLVLLLSACSLGTSARHAKTPQTTASPTASGHAGLPPFSDWRVAYRASDGHLHVVSLDGQLNVQGPNLPGFSNLGANTDTSRVSPNGHWLAYQAGDLVVLDLSGRHTLEGIPDCCDTGTMVWSPDGTQLAFGDNIGDLALFPLTAGTAPGTFVPLPGTQALGIRELVGWIDAT
ncbi:MAG TPA: hypothetical protein VGS80_02065, partial [Ktedonobacterales bacterium]|nr:hypothetical protein [Ktedonobacterales bacterium]